MQPKSPAVYKSPRISFLWIMTAQIFCTLPHLQLLPPWVIVLCLVCLFWRWMVFQGRWNFPPKFARYALVILSVFGLMLNFPQILNIQPAVCLLIITYYLKLLEMFRLKDVYVVLLLSYFVIASAFLFHENVFMSFYFLGAILLTTVAMVSFNRSEEKIEAGGSFKIGLMLSLQAIPIAVCLFLFFPRFPPFWALEIKREGPSVGISESMSPAEVAELGAAEGVAFRVEFEGDLPEPQDRYWRVLTLSEFDGERWESLFSNLQSQLYFSSRDVQEIVKANRQPFGPEYRYSIDLEPTHQPWLPTLDRPIDVLMKSAFMPDFSVVTDKPMTSLASYKGISSLNAALNRELTTWSFEKNTDLPAGSNPKTLAYAQDTYQRLGRNNLQYIQHVMELFSVEPFFYTLKPGLYGQDMVDEFIFDRRKGFCAHYASAMAVLLRSVKIPARVVIGYHGGEVNPLGGHIVVNQYDAHAWVEAWVKGQGWVRFDPTSMVVPWRLILGVEEMMRQTNSTEVPSLQNSLLRSNEMANQLRLLLDYTNHRWNKYVVNFDQESQRELLEKFFDEVNLRKIVAVMVISVGSILALVAFVILWKSKGRRPSKVERCIQKVLDILEKRFGPRHPSQTLNEYLLGLKSKLKPQQYHLVKKLIDHYNRWAYEDLTSTEEKELLKQMKRESYFARRELLHIFK